MSDSPKLHLEPKIKRAEGEREQAQRMAAIAKTLADPVRLRLIDVLRKHAGKVCVCELVPLFDLAQPTISHHLRVLRDAGVIECERQGLWSYYYVLPAALDELAVWLGKGGHLTREPDGSRAVRLPA